MRRKLTSMPSMVLTGFLLVAVPLTMAVVFGMFYVDKLSTQSERLVSRGVEVTRHSQRLKEHVLAMERIARKYQVVGDPSLVQLYEERLGEVIELLNKLERFRLQGVADWNLEQIRGDAEQVLATMHEYPYESEVMLTVLGNFSRMADLTSGISRQGNEFIDEELITLGKTAENAQSYFAWSIMAILPGAAVLIILFTIVFTRPLRQLAGAIRELGAGRFDKPILIKGPPAEMEELAEQLDWLRSQLARLDEEKALFLRNMSHELKTPLASIRESTELLHDGMLGELNERQGEVLGLLRENGLEMERLIENLLQLNVWREGGSQLDYQTVDLSVLIEDIVARHRMSMASAGVIPQLRCAAATVEADPLRLRMIFNNLLSNAVKHSPEGGRIDIVVHDKGDAVCIDVIDQGQGIPAEERELIFKPFFQGKRKGRGYVRGTGIGLSVVRDCVLAHGGTLKLMPRARGTHFRITLPHKPPSG
ncbi:MAG: ATP-binding protein [Salinisphaeraceae bacterium]|nr:ATP-binding protein [Salinisphaeraceae bacterium]